MIVKYSDKFSEVILTINFHNLNETTFEEFNPITHENLRNLPAMPVYPYEFNEIS